MEKEAEKELEKYKKAGEILRKAKENARKSIKPGQKLVEIAEKIEKDIIGMGAKPAFPVNLSINETAAHFTPAFDDKAVFEEKHLLKVDLGAHIDGFIGDCAFSINPSNEYAKLIDTSAKALENALSIAKAGTEIGKIGEEIEKTIKSYGFNPIQNLSGHELGQYKQHAGLSIPNIAKNDSRKLEVGHAYAIEPFATPGIGTVKESSQSEIFALEEPKPIRNPHARAILEHILENYETLPFAERWIARALKLSEFQRKIGMRELLKQNCIRAYPVLKEESNAIVSQAETSIFVTEKETIALI
ncbi:MAG: type II methionyl aminopeptidase, partial [Candidatus Diapherotrites archaeon]|nr:type II methionyl aminopeptidase [Candidatus Diapherotrites archaeon]